MAEKLKTQTLNIPDKVVDSNWKDDIDVDYAIYGGSEKKEGQYISPESVDKETQNKINRIKAKKIGISTLWVLENKSNKAAA